MEPADTVYQHVDGPDAVWCRANRAVNGGRIGDVHGERQQSLMLTDRSPYRVGVAPRGDDTVPRRQRGRGKVAADPTRRARNQPNLRRCYCLSLPSLFAVGRVKVRLSVEAQKADLLVQGYALALKAVDRHVGVVVADRETAEQDEGLVRHADLFLDDAGIERHELLCAGIRAFLAQKQHDRLEPNAHAGPLRGGMEAL